MDIMLQRILELVGTKHGAGKELCDALGVKSNTVTEWKKGRMKSYTKYAPQIADYYGVSLDWLSGLTDDKLSKKETPLLNGVSLDAEIVIEEIINLLSCLPHDKLLEELYYLRRISDDHGIR